MSADNRMAGAEDGRPAITVITATYNRSRALACAIESVRRQTFADWEMLVIGDGCTDDTAEVVARAGDSRIRYFNLERNYGGQAGPNNVGIAESRAPLIAFLSHDDLWLPNHLKSCREALLAEHADLVFGTAANIAADTPLPLRFETLRLNLTGLGPRNRYSPGELDALAVPASCWLARREMLVELAGFPAECDCILPPSQVVLFRAWRAGYRLHALNLITLVVVASGTRDGSYLRAGEPEQEWTLAQLDNPWFGSELAALAPQANNRWAAGRPSWLLRHLALALAHLGLNPRELDFRFRRGLRRGDRSAQLRRVGGLHDVSPVRDPGVALRTEMVRQACRVEIGDSIGFGAGQGGARYLASGWSRPEREGVWSDGPRAELLFRFARRPEKDPTFLFTLRAFPGQGESAREVEVWAGERALLDTWTFAPSDGEPRLLRFPLASMNGALATIRFRFLNPVSPRAAGISKDSRMLGLFLRQLQVGTD